MNKRRLFEHWLDVVFFILIIVSTMSAVSYFSSQFIFDANIVYINNFKTPYSVLLNVENKVGKNLNFEVEVIYKRENLVVASENLDCIDFCEFKLDLKKVFYDDYEILINTKYDGVNHQKKLDFSLDKIDSSNQVIFKKYYDYDINESSLIVEGKIKVENNSQIFFEVFPKNDDSKKYKYNLTCLDICDFSFNLSSGIILGEYKVNVYLPDDVLSSSFFVKLKSEKLSLVKDVKINQTVKLNLSKEKKEVTLVDLMGDVKIISDVENELELPQGYTDVMQGDKRDNNSIKLKPRIESIEKLDDVKNLSLNQVSKSFGFSEIKTDLNKSIKNGFEVQSLREDFNPVESVEEKVFVGNKQRYFDVQDDSFNITLIDDERKIVPGIYKKEKITRFKDGSSQIEENIFAYGLISINTRKPLYHQNENVEILIVVLDKGGFLVSDANVSLEILMPNNESLILSTENFDIVETDYQGVYRTYINSDYLGKYKLFAQVELEDMEVFVKSYFNVVENYPFEILRDVPVTIDPWEGPFKNIFTVYPLNNYRGEYSFTEVFSSDFEIIDTDADEIIVKNESTYLIWKNLNGKVNLYYEAQTPLKTPYLYYLGKSFVDYNEGFTRFYENRSWLFAIDPAAKSCDFTSPCNCGAACASTSQVGHGTIDACTDGDQTYERVTAVRITNLNGDYFGIGDTVQLCAEYKCEASSRIGLAYKSGNIANWAGSHLLLQATNCVNQIREYCTNVVLNSYVGEHHFRALLKYQTDGAGQICYSNTWRDHDDVIIQVLDKVAANMISWNLNNGTNIGNNLNIIRGNVINSSALWDLPLRSAQIRHNSLGTYNWYGVTSYDNNLTFYEFDTSDLSLFPNKGQVTINLIRTQDKFFNISGDSSGTRNFNIFGEVTINQTDLSPNVGYIGINSTMSCQITDNNVGIAYDNVRVDFYKDNVLMGSNFTNLQGWAFYSFTENNIGEYNISCKVEDDLPNFLIASPINEAIRKLIVRIEGADIVPPTISNIQISNNVFSIGGITTISANVIDDVSVGDVELRVLLPDNNWMYISMINTIGNTYSINFVNTLLDGNYRYYIYAEDSSGNPTFSSSRNFLVTGVRTFIGIQSTKSIFKLGENLNLIPFNKVSTITPTVYNEIGDTGSIYYGFTSSGEGWSSGVRNPPGTGANTWEWGDPILASPFNNCNSGTNCWVTSRGGNYNRYEDSFLQSPSFDFTGRSNVVINFWRVLRVEQGTAHDRAYVESFDGTSWNILFEDSEGAGGGELAPGFSTFYPSEVEGVNNARFRFRIQTDGDTTVNRGWIVDDFTITYTPRVDWTKDWTQIASTFGSDVNKVTAVKIEVDITSYSSAGSDLLGTSSPDLEFQVYDGTSYTGNFKCNLDNTKVYPYKCVIVAKSTDYLDAWKDDANRRIRFRAVGLDKDDEITWTNIKREYVTPSIIENNGIGMMTAYLLAQFKNSTGGVVQTLNFAPISLNPGEARNLSDFWTYAISGNFQLGDYSAYVALTDAFGNVLQNEDDNSYINDSYDFEIQSLIINPVKPLWDSVELESLILELTLDTTSYGAGGWCGYSLNGASNVSMNQLSLTHYDYNLGNVLDGENEIVFYCNDSDGDMVDTGIINFNVSQNPRIQFVLPTENSGVTVFNPNTLVNVSVEDSSNTSSYVDFNSSLIGYWIFDNVSGSTVYDDSTHNYNGILSSGAKVGNVDMIRGTYGDFDGIDDALVIQNSKNLEGYKRMTIEAWVKPDLILGNYGYVLAKRDNTLFSYGLAYDTNSGDNWRFYVNDYFSDYIEAPMTRGVWSHVVGVYNSTNLSIYVNGNFIASRAFSDDMLSTPNIDVVVGARRNFQDTGIRWPFAGNLDEVKLWNRALSLEEIKASYNSKINNLDTDITYLKNGVHFYYACAIDGFGNRNCTETRNITIEKDLGTLTVTSPTGVSKFSMSDLIYFNATTSLPQDLLWIKYGNGTIIDLLNVINNDWTYNQMFETGYYNVTFFAKDYLGNILNSSMYLFVVLPDKVISIEKNIVHNLDDTYQINLVFRNDGRWTNHTYLDFKDILFNDYLMSVSPDLTENIFSFSFTGENYVWDVSLAQNTSLSNFYFVNGTGFYNLRNNYVIGLE